MKVKIPSRSLLRGLLKLQKGRCALTGVKLDPKNVSADHIIPMSSSKEDKENKNYGKFWLVSAKLNRMKSNLSLDEFYEIAELLIKHKNKSIEIKDKIFNAQIDEMDKKTFDEYILENYNEDGIIKE